MGSKVKSTYMYKGPRDKDNGWDCQSEVGVGRAGESNGGEWRQLILNNNKKREGNTGHCVDQWAKPS